MNDRTFIELSQRGVDNITTVLAEKHPDLFCSHCSRARRLKAPTEIVLDDNRLRYAPITGDPFHGIKVVKRSLLDLIDIEDLSRYFCTGGVTDTEGNLFEDWIYLYHPDRIIIRGTREAGFRTCPECGHTLYSSQGPEYLYPAPPEDIPIFQSDKSSILVDSRYLDRSRLPKSRWLGSQILKVADKPRDGLGEFPYAYG